MCSNSSSQMNIISSLILADNQGYLGCDGDILQEQKCGEELILRTAKILFKTELFFTTVSLFFYFFLSEINQNFSFS